MDNQKASRKYFQATTFKVEENSRTFQGVPLTFQDCVNPESGKRHNKYIGTHKYHKLGTKVNI